MKPILRQHKNFSCTYNFRWDWTQKNHLAKLVVKHSCLVLLQVPKFFVPVQIFWASPKIWLHLVPLQNLLCWHKKQFYWMQIIFLSGTKIWTSPEYVGTCKGTRHKCELGYSILKGFWIHGIRYSELSFFRHFVRSLYFCMNSMISSRLDGGFKLNFSSFAKISYK